MNPTLPPFVQELLDRGVDPIDDPRAQAWLLEHPETLASFAALRSTLSSLPANAPATRRWQPLAWLAAGGVAAAAAVALWLGGMPDVEAAPEAPNARTVAPLTRPDFATAGGVVHVRASATRVRGTSTNRSVIVFAGAPTDQRVAFGRRAERVQHSQSNHPASSWTARTHVRVETTVERALLP